uniref:Uncharacterized protein n=1 Tax=Plectus sambesii TaxID=2011161 RepID=A0A914V3T5_9BILA
MLNFYGKGKDPFRSTADISIPLIEGRVRSVRADLGAKLLKQAVEGELYKNFDVGSQTSKWYLDEEGDLVILDDLDSFQVAYDFARKSGKGLKVVVDAVKKEGNLTAEFGIP